MAKHRVVIVGGGFGGLQAALNLKGADVDVTIVDRRNFHLFQPLAYQVATGALATGEVAYPLRSICAAPMWTSRSSTGATSTSSSRSPTRSPPAP